MAESTSIEARHYTFKPREDITAFELATALPVLISGSITAYDALPENVKRHFELESDRP